MSIQKKKISGYELKLQPAKYRHAAALKRALFKAIKENGINIGLDDIAVNSEDLLKSNVSGDAVEKIINLVLSVGISEEIEEALFKCCDKVVLFGPENEIVSEDFFDDPVNRPFYYPIMFEVAKVNLLPFFEKLSFLFQGAGELKDIFQKLK